MNDKDRIDFSIKLLGLTITEKVNQDGEPQHIRVLQLPLLSKQERQLLIDKCFKLLNINK